MAGVIGIGHQDFGQLIQNDYFYVDKTKSIKEWWESGDAVTLIPCPRRGMDANGMDANGTDANGMDAIIVEFKVQDSDEKELADTVASALTQIDRMQYEAALIQRGIPRERIRKYGFAFRDKEVLIG